MTDHQYQTLIDRLRAQFGTAIEPFLGALTGLIERTDLVPRSDYDRAMNEIQSLRVLVDSLESRIDDALKERSSIAPDDDSTA